MPFYNPPINTGGAFQYQQSPVQQQATNNVYPQILAFVHGIQGAINYSLGPNSKALLMDLDEDVFYIKTTDPFARPYPLEAYDFTKKALPDTSPVSRDEYNKLVQMMEEQKKLLEDLTK